MQPDVFTIYESSSQLRMRRLRIFGGTSAACLLAVAMCGVGGGSGAAYTALVMLGFAAVLVAFVVRLGILPFLHAQPKGQVTVEPSAVRESESGRRIDFTQPHTVTVLCSPHIVRTRVAGRHADYEHSLLYDWVAFVFEQGGTRLTFTQDKVDASHDSGLRGERRVNRWFLGRAPTPHDVRPDGIRVGLMEFDPFEGALGKAISEGVRLGLAAGKR